MTTDPTAPPDPTGSPSRSDQLRTIGDPAVDRLLAPTGLGPLVGRAPSIAATPGIRSSSPFGAIVRLLAPAGAPRWPLGRLLARTGFEQFVVRREAIASVLGLGDLQVPYGSASRALGLGAFPLSVDGPEHDDARALVRAALHASVGTHRDGVAAADAVAADRVARGRGRVDANGAIVAPALHRWVEVWFGLPGQGQRLADVAALATRAIFFNPASPTGTPDPVVLAEAVQAADRFVADLRRPLADAPAGTLVAALRNELSGDDGDVDLDEVGRFVIGLSVGPLTLGTWSLTNVIAALASQPPGLDDLADGAGAAAAYRRALRAAPPLPGVPRLNPRGRTVVSDLGSFTLPAGWMLAATGIADAADPVDPGDDPPDVDLPFSAGSHRCMGPDHITDVAAVILHRLARRRPRLVDPNRPIEPGVPVVGTGPWPFPGRLPIELAPGA